jgi:hypothetical protein
MTMQRKRRGFALPMTILLILLMTAGAAAAFTRVTAEVRVMDNLRTETAAFAVAEAGLERYLARVGQLVEDTMLALPGGRARVRATLIRPALKPGDTALYLIRSDGVVAGGGAAIPEGRRTVAQLAQRIRGRLPVSAIWTSLGGLEKAGASGTITGFDGCVTDTIAGVRVPEGGFVQSGGGQSSVQGSPAIEQVGTSATLANQLGFDWAALANPLGSTLTTDAIICYPGTHGYDSRWGPCGSWPAPSAWSNANYWPTIIINGSYTDLPNTGRGVLLVTGDLTLGGGDRWDGVIMVGNRIDDNGGGAIGGAVFTGLDAVTGQAVDQSRADGTKDYQFDSCKVASAADRQSRWRQIPNAWVDNWSSW